MGVRVILISHGELSKGMANSAQMIMGQKPNLSYYGVYPDQHPCNIIKEIKDEILKNKNEQFIIIADIFGGSAWNAAIELIELQNVKLLCGMNLPLIIGIVLHGEAMSDDELQEEIINGQNGIKLFSKKLLKKQAKDEDDFF